MERISNEETVRLINHALASSEKMTSKKLGDLINAPYSRLSEGKSGEWTLTEEQASKLIDLFGQPRSEPGDFVRAESVSSLKEFIEDEPYLSEKRHWVKLIRAFSSPKTKARLFDILSNEQKRLWDIRRDLNDNIVYEPEKPDEDEIFVVFNEFVASDEFKCWMSSAKNWMLRASKSGFDGEELHWRSKSILFYNIDVIDELPLEITLANDRDFPFDKSITIKAQGMGLNLDGIYPVGLMLLGDFYHQLNSPESIEYPGLPESYEFCESLTTFDASELNDYVITGDVVWEHEGRFASAKIGRSICKNIVGDIPEYDLLFPPVLRRGDSLVSEKTVQSCQVDCWTTYSVKLYVNENCDYSLLLELGQQKPTRAIPEPYHLAERHIVIPKILGRELFNDLATLREWLDLEVLPEIEIKKNIAKAGGFIPGAKVL